MRGHMRGQRELISSLALSVDGRHSHFSSSAFVLLVFGFVSFPFFTLQIVFIFVLQWLIFFSFFLFFFFSF